MANFMQKAIEKTMSAGAKLFGAVSQNESKTALGDANITEGMPELLRQAAADGAVLLKNNAVLPLPYGSSVSIFSRVQIDWFFTGYGSGGDVQKPYRVNLLDGLSACDAIRVNEDLSKIYRTWSKEHPIHHGFWGHWPRFYPDMPLTDKIVKTAREKSEVALFVIGRSSGEDRENTLEKGSYYLTDTEKENLNRITNDFEKTIVLLNIGSIIDMSWLEAYGDKIGAVLLLWQGGMESGNAVADLLCGKVNPSGKLTDTIAKAYSDYPSSACFGKKDFTEYREDIYVGYRYFETFAPDSVLYPFGYGLSYTDFKTEFLNVHPIENGITLSCRVQNTGHYAGRETVGVYLEKPNGVLGNPRRVLVGFQKTSMLFPTQSETLQIQIEKESFTSYDDSGKTEFPYAYSIEQGKYTLYLGINVQTAEKVWSYQQTKTICTEQLKQVAAPKETFKRLTQKDGNRAEENTPTVQYDLKEVILKELPKAIPIAKNKKYTLKDVKDSIISLDDFAATLSYKELEAISRGDYTMDSQRGAKGNAGVLGGVLDSLEQKGVMPLTTTDGPSGIRLRAYCSLLPIGTLLACTFDTELCKAVYAAVGKEMRQKGSHILLAPGMNIHRNPLCGRNFEYYSEDPYVTGTMAAAAVLGLQSQGVSACPKHFACNNQETNRTHNDSRVSERALREIYLKGFEICVKQAKPNCMMTSYNRINGVWGHYHYELCTRILRQEWNYQGLVMTDWWMRYKRSPEFPKLRDNAYRVRAGVDVLMPGGKRIGPKKPDGTLLKTLEKPEGITLGELQNTAKHVLSVCLQYVE